MNSDTKRLDGNPKTNQMKVKRKDLDPAQVARMKGVYGMSDQQIMTADQQIVDPSELKPRPAFRPTRQSISKQYKYS